MLIAADDPEGMLRHTRECRQRGYRFIADPSQQLAFSEGDLIRDLIDGATYLFSNEYESAMIESKTGWSADEILARVGTQVTTLGADGVRILARDADPIEVKAAAGVTAVEPTGVGDAFRAGFLAGLEWELGHERVGPDRLRARGVRRGDRRHPGVHVQRRSSSSSGSGCRTATTRPTRSAPASPDPAYDVARDAVLGGLLADVLLTGHPAPRRYVVPRGRVVGDHADQLTDRDVADPARQLDDRAPGTPARGSRGRASQPRPQVAERPAGSTARKRSTSSSVVSRPTDTRTLPWVRAPIAASTWLGSSADDVHADPLATSNPRRSSSVTSASPST